MNLSEAVIKTNIYSKYLQQSIHFVCLCSNQSIVKIMALIVEDVKSDLSSLLDALMTPKEFTGPKLNMLD